MSDTETVPEVAEPLLQAQEMHEDGPDDRRRRRLPKRNNLHAEINELRCKLQEQQTMVEALWGALSSAGAALGVIGSPDGRRVAPVPSLSQPFLQQEVEGGHYSGANHYNRGGRSNYNPHGGPNQRGRHPLHRDGRVDASSFSQRAAQH